MKEKILTLFLVFCLYAFSVHISNAQWVQVSSGLPATSSIGLASGEINIFARTGTGNVYLSTNNGTGWTSTGMTGQFLYTLAVFGNNVYAGCYNGMFLSTNNSTNWNQTSLNNRPVQSIAINGENIFAGTLLNNGVYLSTNNGTTWEQTSLNSQTVAALAINGNSIFAGITIPAIGVYISTNNGVNWNQTSLNNLAVYRLAVNGNNIFAGAAFDYGVYLSTDNGTTWNQTSLNNRSINSLVVDGTHIFAATEGAGVYVSINNGTNWVQRNEGLGSATVGSLSKLNNYLYAGTNSGVYRRPVSELTGITPISNEVPQQFYLSQNFPNPFNPTTKIRFALPKSSIAKLIVYDMLGKEISTLVNGDLNAGTYEAEWSADSFSSGTYYYKLITDGYTETKKMALIK